MTGTTRAMGLASGMRVLCPHDLEPESVGYLRVNDRSGRVETITWVAHRLGTTHEHRSAPEVELTVLADDPFEGLS